MPSTKEFKDFVIDQLRALDDIACKQMMGEYLLYYHGVLFGGIYDDRFLIKKTNSNSKYLLEEAIPYEKARPMYIIDNIEDVDYLTMLIRNTYMDLKK